MDSLIARNESYGKTALPLVRLSLVLPFVDALDRLRMDVEAVLMANGLVRETVRDPSVFVPAIVVYRFVEEAAAAAGDPHFGAHVGEMLNVERWPPLVDAASQATTLGEFLIRFIRAARDDASSVHHALEIGAPRAVFRAARTSEPEILPSHNDAFGAAFLLGLLRRGAGASWNAADVRITVCDPAALPDRYLGVHIAAGDRTGLALSYPTEWLLRPLDPRALLRGREDPGYRLDMPTEFLDAVREALRPHLHNAALNVDYVARLTGLSRQALQRRLKASGTTLSAVVVELRQQRATRALVRSDESVAEIAASVGFGNPTSFTRAFRSWTGQSPRQYRLSHRRS